MKILSTKSFIGPSLYSPVAATCLAIDDGVLRGQLPSGLGPVFTDGLVEFLPGLASGDEARGQTGSFVDDLRGDTGITFAHVIARVALELQRQADMDVAYASAQRGPRGPHGPQANTTLAVFAHWDPHVGLAAGETAVSVIGRLAGAVLRNPGSLPPDWNPAAEREKFDTLALSQLQLSGSFLAEASRRDIPWRRLNQRTPFVRFGYGRFQKTIQGTITPMTPVVGMWVSTDKNTTNRLLAEIGVPVPSQGLAANADQAVSIAGAIGYPIAVKPHGQDMGRGVSVGLKDPAAVRRAFAAAAKFGGPVIVERFIPGHDHRILVVGGKVVAAARLTPAHVVGDGTRTVAQLIDETNRDPLRVTGYHPKRLARIDLDAHAREVLAAAGLRPDSVPAAGQTVFLRSNANLAGGGTSADVTEAIHPDNRRMAIRAVKALGLDVAGVDFLTTDIGRSYRDVGGAICEINVLPALRVHWLADGGRHDVYGPIMDLLYPPATPSRIPIAAITGTMERMAERTATGRLVARILQAAGHTTGHAAADCANIGSEQVVTGNAANFRGARLVLQDPSTDMAVLETEPQSVIDQGLAFDRCDVAAVTGMATADRPDEVRAIAVVARSGRDTVVLDADDERCVDLGGDAVARRICYVGVRPENPVIADHVASGGLAVTLAGPGDGKRITIYDGGRAIDVIAASDLGAAGGTATRLDLLGAMFATAITYSLGKSAKQIREGLAGTVE